MNTLTTISRKIIIIGCAMGLILLVNIGMMSAGPEFRPPSPPSDVSDNGTNDINSTHRPPPRSPMSPQMAQVLGIAIPAISLLWISRWAMVSVARKEKGQIPDSEHSNLGIGIILAVTSVTLWPLIFEKGFFSNLPDMSAIKHIFGVLAVLVPTIGIGYLLHILAVEMKEHGQDEEE